MDDPGLFSGLVLFVLLSVIGSIAVCVSQSHRQTLQFQVSLFLCAFALRFAMSVVIYQFGLVEVLKDEDANGWLGGVGIQRTWMQQGVGLLDLPFVTMAAFEGVDHNRGYPYLLGVLFYLTDAPARLPAAALNGFFGALTVVFASRIAITLFSPWVAVRVGWWACLFPSLIVWSAQTVKEPIVIWLVTLALYACVRLRSSGFSPQHVLLCALSIVFLVPFRFYAAYIVGAAVTLSLMLPQINRRKMTVGSALGVAAFIVGFLVFSGVLARHETEVERYDLQYVQHFRQNLAVGTGSGVVSRYDLRTPEEVGLAIGVGAAHLLLAPFPWQFGDGSLRMLLTAPELVVWWWLFFVGVLPGLWYAIRNRFSDIQPILFLVSGMGLLYSLAFGNVGLAYRQRAQLLPWLLIFAMVGLEQRVWRRKREGEGVKG